jgi:hypothetical protein
MPNWLCFARLAQVKAWNSYSIGGIVALRCLKKPENTMSRLWGPEIPAPPSAATKTDPLAKTRRAPRRQDSDALTLGDLGVFARDIILWVSTTYVVCL